MKKAIFIFILFFSKSVFANIVGSWMIDVAEDKQSAFLVTSNEKKSILGSYCYALSGCVWTLTFKDDCKGNEQLKVFISANGKVTEGSLVCFGKNSDGSMKHVFQNYDQINGLITEGAIGFSILLKSGLFDSQNFQLKLSEEAKLQFAAINSYALQMK